MSCVLGLTGGIASGKSIFTQLLRKHFGAELFDCDLVARELFEKDELVQNELRAFFPEAIRAERVDREAVRAIVFGDKARRIQIEGILHPRIHQAWRALADGAKRSGRPLLVDIPLLFETESEKYFDRVIVVGCMKQTQIRRLKFLRNLDEHVSQAIIDSQWNLEDKIAKADHLIWNESSLDHLEVQAKLLGGYFQQRYG